MKARHRFLGEVVSWQKIKSTIGDGYLIRIVFESGETTTMSIHRFNELFEII